MHPGAGRGDVSYTLASRACYSSAAAAARVLLLLCTSTTTAASPGRPPGCCFPHGSRAQHPATPHTCATSPNSKPRPCRMAMRSSDSCPAARATRCRFTHAPSSGLAGQSCSGTTAATAWSGVQWLQEQYSTSGSACCVQPCRSGAGEPSLPVPSSWRAMAPWWAGGGWETPFLG